MPEKNNPTDGIPAQPPASPVISDQRAPVISHKNPEPKDFIGMKLEAAEALADKHKMRHRVVMVDGKHRIVTRDHRPDRMNFTVVKGIVTEVRRG